MFDKKKLRVYSRLGQRGAIFADEIFNSVTAFPNLVVLTADLAILSGLDRFSNEHSQQFINVGIAEQNLIGIAAGLSSEGYIPVVTTYATFITKRPFEQISHYCGYMDHKIVILGSGAGFAQTFSGNTHFSNEDLALMRTIPNMTVLAPSDAFEAVKSFQFALTAPGSVYIRLSGALACPIVHREEFDLENDRWNVHSEGADILVIANGYVVDNCIKAAEKLTGDGINCRVISSPFIKPFPDLPPEILKKYKKIVTVEEHSVIGGLGSAVAEYLATNGVSSRLRMLGVKDRFSSVGSHEHLLDDNRLSSDSIAHDIGRFFYE